MPVYLIFASPWILFSALLVDDLETGVDRLKSHGEVVEGLLEDESDVLDGKQFRERVVHLLQHAYEAGRVLGRLVAPRELGLLCAFYELRPSGRVLSPHVHT